MSASYPSLGVRYLILNVSKCLGLGICLNEVRKLSFYNIGGILPALLSSYSCNPLVIWSILLSSLSSKCATYNKSLLCFLRIYLPVLNTPVNRTKSLSDIPENAIVQTSIGETPGFRPQSPLEAEVTRQVMLKTGTSPDVPAPLAPASDELEGVQNDFRMGLE